MKRKILSLLFCTVLVLGLMATMPFSASAAAEVVVQKPSQPWYIGEIIEIFIKGLDEPGHVDVYLGPKHVFEGPMVFNCVEFKVPPLEPGFHPFEIYSEGQSVHSQDVWIAPGEPWDICTAISHGIYWLVEQQNEDGSWGQEFPVAKTALAVLKLAEHAVDEECNPQPCHPLDPNYIYHDNVARGLDYLMLHANQTGISLQIHGDPDTHDNDQGVYFVSDPYGEPIYETAIALLALSASRDPSRVVSIPGSPVDGWTYWEVAQDTVDYLAWAQTDMGSGRGGWGYEPRDNWGDGSDNSVSGYVTLGLAAAESLDYGFECAIPYFVRHELNIWIDYIQIDVAGEPNHHGGSGYHLPDWANILRTGNLIQQMAFYGDDLLSERVQDAIAYIARHWYDESEHWDPGWRGAPWEPACYQATFTLMKGLEVFGIGSIDGIDWFVEVSDMLLAQQNCDGSWPSSCFDEMPEGEGILSTEWALLTLQRVSPPPSPPPPPPPPIERGVAWLVAQQNEDGSWGQEFPVAKTALAVLKLEEHAVDEEYGPGLLHPLEPHYIYHESLMRGLGYLMLHANQIGISRQPHGNPDTDGDGHGVYFVSPGSLHTEIYETGIVLLALSASRCPELYGEVVQDAVDYLAWAQTDEGSGRGGWGYEPVDNASGWSDNSISGWVTLGLTAAESPEYGFGFAVPYFVRQELNIWIDYIQNDVDGDPNDGGSGYTDPDDWVNILKTGNLIQQMAFYGDEFHSQRVQDAIAYIARHWYDESSDPGWRGAPWAPGQPWEPACYQATFTVMKGFETFGIDRIGEMHEIDWFVEVSDVLLREQSHEGSWPSSCWDEAPGEQILSTVWALLTLQRVSPPPSPPPPVEIVLEVPECACDIDSYDVIVTYTVGGSSHVNVEINGYYDEDEQPSFHITRTGFPGTETYTYTAGPDLPGEHVWKVTIDVAAQEGTSAHVEDDDFLDVCPTPQVGDIPDQSAPFEPFDLDGCLEDGASGSGVFGWSVGGVPVGWTVAIDPGNIVTVTATAGASEPAIITFTASVECCGGVVCSDSDAATFTPNQPPKADVGPDVTIREGDGLTLDGTGSTDPDDDLLTGEWDFAGDIFLGLCVVIEPGASPGQSPALMDDFAGIATLYVSDGHGGSDSDTTNVTVLNVAPVVDAGPDDIISEGGTFSSSGSFTDPGADTWNATVNYGDESGIHPLTLNPEDTFDLSHAYDDNGVYRVTVTVTDDDGGVGADTVSVTVLNVAPQLADLSVASPIDENDFTTLSGGIVDPGPLDTFVLSVDWGDGSPLETFNYPAGTTTFSEAHQYLDDNPSGTSADDYGITVTVADDDTGEGTDTTTVTVSNVAPVLGDIVVTSETYENGWADLTGTFTDPGTLDSHEVIIVWNDGESDTIVLPMGERTFSATHRYLDDNPTGTPFDILLVSVTVVDDDGGQDQACWDVTVHNAPPVLGEITATLDPVEAGTAISAGADFTDVGTQDTHTATWDWGDETTSEGTVAEANGSGSVTGEHIYGSVGVFTVKLTVADDDTGDDESVFQYIVVYDPGAGFVTGGGWIHSPEGAYAPDPTLTGKATFGFISKYRKGASTPAGQTQFHFRVADLNFHSDSYEWLVIAGAKAMYKGTGTINGKGEYRFILSAIDADVNDNDAHTVDRFRIKIWDAVSGEVVYDNQMGDAEDAVATMAIGGGSIVIHKK